MTVVNRVHIEPDDPFDGLTSALVEQQSVTAAASPRGEVPPASATSAMGAAVTSTSVQYHGEGETPPSPKGDRMKPETTDLVADSVVTVATPDDGDERLWSVTTILKAFGDSEGLIYWSVDETAQAAVNGLKTVTAMAADDGAAAVEWLRGARFRASKGERSATKLGEDVHAACEQYVVTGIRPANGDRLPNGEVDAEVNPYIDSFELWLDRFQPEYTAAEMTVYNPQYGYAGTLDGHAIVDGTPVIIDYKTSKKSFDGRGKRKMPWTDVALQMAAYRAAPLAAVWRARRFEQYSRRYYLLNNDERQLAQPTPAVEGGLVIQLTPQHCDVYPVDCGDTVFDGFLYAIEAARWSMFTSKKVFGEPLALLDNKRT